MIMEVVDDHGSGQIGPRKLPGAFCSSTCGYVLLTKLFFLPALMEKLSIPVSTGDYHSTCTIVITVL